MLHLSVTTIHRKEVESTKLETTANEIVASHLIGATTISVGYGEIEDGNKYTTVGAEKKIGENFSLYGAFQQTDVAYRCRHTRRGRWNQVYILVS